MTIWEWLDYNENISNEGFRNGHSSGGSHSYGSGAYDNDDGDEDGAGVLVMRRVALTGRIMSVACE